MKIIFFDISTGVEMCFDILWRQSVSMSIAFIFQKMRTGKKVEKSLNSFCFFPKYSIIMIDELSAKFLWGATGRLRIVVLMQCR